MTIKLDYIQKPKLKNPAMIAGLPGIANVGKLAIEYLIYQTRAEKFLELHSEHFPEWAIPVEGGIRTLRMDFFHARPEGIKRDLILMSSDAQAATPLGQYALTGEILDIAQEQGVTTFTTMAAYVLSSGVMKMKPVVGVASSKKLTAALKKSGVEMLESGVIVGMNGLLPAFAAMRGMDGYCLLGVTSGGMIDPNASRAVLQSLSAMLGFSIDTTELGEHAERLEAKMPKLKEAPEEETSYIR